MDYERKYKEALERARKIENREPIDVPDGTSIPVTIFPELKESEDERIRKELIRAFKSLNTIKVWNGIERTNILAWLEKQGEQKPFNYESANIQQKDFAPKVESKFRKGDIIKHNRVNIICKVILVNSVSYYVENIKTRAESELFYAEENFHLWTIEDVKDGNVLYSPEHNLLWIYKDKDTYHVATNLNYPNNVSIGGDIVMPSDVCPASKEQCDILFARIKKYGYKWDEDTKKLIIKEEIETESK